MLSCLASLSDVSLDCRSLSRRGPLLATTLLANSKAAIWTAMLGGKPRSELKRLIGFWASSGLIVEFANSVLATSGHRPN
jgi:hypothetical protein